MADACSVWHAANKRSLPAWMLKSCSSNQAVKAEDPDANTSESDEQSRNLDQNKSMKRNSGRRLKDVDSEGAGEPGVMGRCKGRAKSRKTSKNTVKGEVKEIQDEDTGSQLNKVDSDGKLGVLRRCGSRENSRRMSKNVVKDEVKEIVERAAPKNSRKRKLPNSKSEASSPEAIDDEIELTVEDLVSIAEEYVNADEQKQQQLGSVNTARHYEHTSCHTVSTECTSITRKTIPNGYGRDESSSHQELPCSSSFKTTGDVLQDMINVFLGPLFSKSAGSIKEPEHIESDTTTIYHVPEKEDWHSEVPRQEELG